MLKKISQPFGKAWLTKFWRRKSSRKVLTTLHCRVGVDLNNNECGLFATKGSSTLGANFDASLAHMLGVGNCHVQNCQTHWVLGIYCPKMTPSAPVNVVCHCWFANWYCKPPIFFAEFVFIIKTVGQDPGGKFSGRSYFFDPQKTLKIFFRVLTH